MGDPSRDSSERLSARLLKGALHTYWRFARPMTLGVRAAVLDGEGSVFLIRHTYVRGWHLPGGGVEAGETVLDALRRELEEEARIEPLGEPELKGVFHNTSASSRDHVLVYAIRQFRVIEPKRPDREIAEAGFFPVEAMPEGTTRATRDRVREILSGEPPSPRW